MRSKEDVPATSGAGDGVEDGVGDEHGAVQDHRDLDLAGAVLDLCCSDGCAGKHDEAVYEEGLPSEFADLD